MNGLIWVGQVVLAGVFLASGTFRLFALTPLVHVLETRTHRQFGLPSVPTRIMGFVEVVLAFGVLMPDIYTPEGTVPEYLIVRCCAAGLALLMIGLAIYHVRRKEHAALDVAFFLLALFVIVGRWPS